MIGNVITSDTTAEDWPAVRTKILARIVGTMGSAPANERAAESQELRRYKAYGLEHVHIRYHVVEDHWNEAVIVLPEQGGPAPAVLTIHGTNGETGKLGTLNADNLPGRAYGIELAQRGYVTVSPDQYGFGASLVGKKQQDVFNNFYARWPEWSLDGMRTLEQQRAIDLLETLDYVDGTGGFGVIGNSLGGRAALHLAAMDERITAAVPSCGLSPVCSNVYRLQQHDAVLCPALTAQLRKDGKAIWDYQEMLALCAGRAVLLLEPFNDPYNPNIASVMECFDAARCVYELVAAPEKLAIYVHGDGHDTIEDVRELAYRWIDRHLRNR